MFYVMNLHNLSNALKYCDKEGPKTQGLWLSQFMLIAERVFERARGAGEALA